MFQKTKFNNNFIKNCSSSFSNFNIFYKKLIQDFKKNIQVFKFTISNLRKVNLDLGIYHLTIGNTNDAIVRFKIINKFFAPKDEEVFYYLGWCYYFKRDIPQALIYLEQSNNIEAKKLEYFLRDIQANLEMPESLWIRQRELMITQLNSNNLLYTKEFATGFIKLILKSINELPDRYNILEICRENKFLSEEIILRFPQELEINIVEPSSIFYNELTSISNNNYYHNVILSSPTEFLTINKNKFDIIISCNGIPAIKNLDETLLLIYNNLQNNGYFALTILNNGKDEEETSFSQINKAYNYNHNILKEIFKVNNFQIIYSGKLSLGINNNYSILIGQKKL